jgi:hypothetical protein
VLRTLKLLFCRYEKVLDLVFLSVICAILGYYFGNKIQKSNESYKLLPTLYAYHDYSDKASNVFVASEAECLSKIDNYYKTVEQGTDTTIPGCFEHGLQVNSAVHIIGDGPDSSTVEIVHFYKSINGKEKKLTGYVAKRFLHEKQFLK